MRKGWVKGGGGDCVRYGGGSPRPFLLPLF
jgi:hypothetical protein